jgi:DNA-binding MarR family transcriptional regulator
MTAIENVLGAQGVEEIAVHWLEQIVPRIMRRLMDSDNLDSPLLQLPLAQIRLAQALHADTGDAGDGETMGGLSQRLGVRHSALTQAADRLIHNGLAERVNDARDRRIVRLRLTQKGREWVGERRDRRRARLAQLWSVLALDERSAFLRAVVTLDAATSRLVSLSPAGAVSENMNRLSTPPPSVEAMLAHLAADCAETGDARRKGAGAAGIPQEVDMTPGITADKEGE